MHNEQTIDAQALDLMLRAGSRWVLWLLIILSIAAAAVVLERLWYFLRERRPRRRSPRCWKRYAPRAEGRAQGAGGRAFRWTRRGAGCLDHLSEGGGRRPRSKWRRCLNPSAFATRRGLAYLGTLGSNAPFIGLFGTVLGIVRAFHDLARSSAALGTQAVMAGIAEALGRHGGGSAGRNSAVATYNVLMRHVETALASRAHWATASWPT